MSDPIPIPKRSFNIGNNVNQNKTTGIYMSNYSNTNNKKTKVIINENETNDRLDSDRCVLICPGGNSNYSGFITGINSKESGYKVISLIIGKKFESKNMQYIVNDQDEDIYNIDDICINRNEISYKYIIYYNPDRQNDKLPYEYNKVISNFSGIKLWGNIILIDNSDNNKIINSLHMILKYSNNA